MYRAARKGDQYAVSACRLGMLPSCIQHFYTQTALTGDDEIAFKLMGRAMNRN
jgi:hypothetical protein